MTIFIRFKLIINLYVSLQSGLWCHTEQLLHPITLSALTALEELLW